MDFLEELLDVEAMCQTEGLVGQIIQVLPLHLDLVFIYFLDARNL